MKVYVVMGNDYPAAVFRREADADKHCADKKKEGARIHWRVYEFELK